MILTISFLFSSGYLKAHGIKIQTLSFPDGMWGSVWSCSMKHNDLGALNMSGLAEYLLEVLPSVEREDGGKINMAIYGDSIFRPSLTILRKIANPKNKEEKLLNRRLNRCRTSIEMLYGELFNLFKLLSTKKKLKLFRDGRHVKKMITVAFFFQNCHSCLNGGNCVTSMFNAVVPTLEEYLHLDEDTLPLDEGDDEISLGYTYDYGGKCKKYISDEDIIIDVQPGSLYNNLQPLMM
jgi:hypothetical protein